MPSGPQFTVHDLKQQPCGATVVVSLRNAANVRLMDGSNYRAYKAGRRHRYLGGLVKKSPVRLQVPSSGHWYVTVDLVGLGGRVSSSAQVEPPPLKPLRSSSSGSLDQIRHELPPDLNVDVSEVWDVFISHASEDKEAVARPLAEELRSRGVNLDPQPLPRPPVLASEKQNLSEARTPAGEAPGCGVRVSSRRCARRRGRGRSGPTRRGLGRRR